MKFRVFSKKEKNQIQGRFRPKGPKTKKEEAEFGPGKTDILICKSCGIFYWYKSWHHCLENYAKLKKSKNIKFTLCPACQMIKDKKYEGEIIIENVREEIKDQLKILIENFGKRAFKKDPLDRVISIKEKKVRRPTNARKRGAISRKEFIGMLDIRVLTTENQLAQKLANKIKQIYGKKSKTSISHSHQEDTIRVKIVFENLS